MAGLPFVVQPRRKPIIERIGSEDSGIIEIERRGYLTTGEKSFVQQVQQVDGGANEIITLSRRVARQYGMGMEKAYKLVLAIISGATGEPEDAEVIGRIEIELAEELTAVVRGMATAQAREELVHAACLIRYRIDQDFEISQISEVHPDIISGLSKLYREEELKLLEAFDVGDKKDKPEPSIEELEKKPGKTTKSRSSSTTGS